MSVYIHLIDTVAADSDEVAGGFVLDFAADGSLAGIDVQHASLKTDIQSLSLSHLPVRELPAA